MPVEYYQRNIGGWIRALHEHGADQLAIKLAQDDGQKSEALERAALAGLPVYQMEIVSLTNFLKSSEALFQRLQSPLYWATLLPLDPSLAKRTRLALSREELLDFAQHYSDSKNGYDFLVSEYEENIYGGNIISSEDGVCVELAPGDQIKVAQGLTKEGELVSAVRNKLNPSFSYSTEDVYIRQLIWRALHHIRQKDCKLERATDIEFLKGYFEFAITKSPQRINPRVVFFDYKITPSFMDFNP